MKIKSALQEAVNTLSALGIESASVDARYLLAHTLGQSTAQLLARQDEDLEPEEFKRFQTYVSARQKRQPVAQIIGVREFWGRRFKVTRATLDPRPETETIIAEILDGHVPKQVLDLGTGTGCLLITILCEFPNAYGVATDVSDGALEVARENAKTHSISGRMKTIQSDWFEGVQGVYDLIVSNPPYISADEFAELAPDVKDWEPSLALTPGGDGLAPYRAIASELLQYLSSNGVAFFEFGASQAVQVKKIFDSRGAFRTKITNDLNGLERIIEVRHA